MLLLRDAISADIPRIHVLLREAELPVDGVDLDAMELFVAESGGTIQGVVGFEQYGDVALARSLAVAPEVRDTGIGRRLVEHLLAQRRLRGIDDLYILTTTAEQYAGRFGFETIPRGRVDPRVTASIEFRGACPDTAVLMVHRGGSKEAL